MMLGCLEDYSPFEMVSFPGHIRSFARGVHPKKPLVLSTIDFSMPHEQPEPESHLQGAQGEFAAASSGMAHGASGFPRDSTEGFSVDR